MIRCPVRMKGCLLDQRSFDRDDIRLQGLLNRLDHWVCYPSSRPIQVAERIQGCEVVVTNKVPLDRAAIGQSDVLQLVLVAATGTDHVDLPACRERGVVVCNATGYSRPAVVQHTLALMLNLMTHLPAYREAVHRGDWCRSDVFCLLDHPIRELEGRTLGILGYGDIGREVARIGQALGMRVVIAARPRTEPTGDRLGLEDFLATSDVISLHCPLNRDTRCLLSTAQFHRMKSNAVLINTARGGIVDPQALARALRSGQIAGAGIDVLDPEPPPPDHPLLATDIPNLIVTPHNAWGTLESRQRLVSQLEANLVAWQSGAPRNVVH